MDWLRYSVVVMAFALGACGDDGGGDTTVSNDDSCQSLCGCDGCPQTGPSATDTATSTGNGSGSASGSSAGPGSTSTAGPSDSSSGGPATNTATGTETGAPAECTCSPEDPTWILCPEEANCQDPGAECCTAEGLRRECVENDIGVVWLTPAGC